MLQKKTLHQEAEGECVRANWCWTRPFSHRGNSTRKRQKPNYILICPLCSSTHREPSWILCKDTPEIHCNGDNWAAFQVLYRDENQAYFFVKQYFSEVKRKIIAVIIIIVCQYSYFFIYPQYHISAVIDTP